MKQRLKPFLKMGIIVVGLVMLEAGVAAPRIALPPFDPPSTTFPDLFAFVPPPQPPQATGPKSYPFTMGADGRMQYHLPSGGQIIRTLEGSIAPGADKLERLSLYTSFIVEARVTEEGRPQSVKHGPVNPSGEVGAFAWRDFKFDQVQVLRSRFDTPVQVTPLIVRVYEAETPEVWFSAGVEPDFKIGERYILFLMADGLVTTIGPPHWRVVSGISGAFLIAGDKVSRKRMSYQTSRRAPWRS